MHNIEELRQRVIEFQHITEYRGYICLGKGLHCGYDDRYGIDKHDLFTDEVDRDYPVTPDLDRHPSSNWGGDSNYFYYFVTADYYNTNIKEQTTTPMSPTEKYNAAAQAFINLTNLKVGSKVRVTHKAKGGTYGWETGWNSDMDVMVGKEFVVSEIDEDFDVMIKVPGDYFYFPFFVLEVLQNEPVTIPLESGEYTVKVLDGGDIQVGCQNISKEKLDEIHAASLLQR